MQWARGSSSEGSRSSPCLRAMWRLRTPTQCGRSGWTQEVPEPYGGSEASAIDMELPFFRGTWRLRTHPQAENRSGAIGLVTKEPGPWAWLLRPLRVVTGNYAGPALLQ